MKHLESLRQEKEQEACDAKRRKRPFFSAVIIGLLVVGSIGFSLTALHEPGEDHLSTDELSQIQEEFSHLGKLHLNKVLANQTGTIISQMELNSQEEHDLRSRLNQNSSLTKTNSTQALQLVWLNLWDFAQQDGDIVSVSTSGYTATCPLYKSHTQIAIPVTQNSSITISGITDGGGGITMGVMDGHSQVPYSIVLQSGASLELPVTF